MSIPEDLDAGQVHRTTVAARPDDASIGGHGDGPSSRWQRALVVIAVAVVLPCVLVALVAVQSPEFSRLDEPAHSDYLRRVENGEVPRIGDFMLDETVAEVQCRSVQGRTNAPCGLDSYEAWIVGAGGYQYQAQQPPLYYAATVVLRQFTRIGPANSFVVSARLTGGIWLSAGLLVFVVACRRLGCRFWPTVIVTGLLTISPLVLYQAATINNDASLILIGALMLLMFARTRGSPSTREIVAWSLVTPLLMMVKPTALIAVGAAIVAVVVDRLVERGSLVRGDAVMLVPGVTATISYVAWGLIRDARATVDYDVVLDALLANRQIDDFPIRDVLAASSRFLFSYSGGGIPIGPTYVTQQALLVGICLLAAGTISLWAPSGGDAAHRLGTVTLATMLVGGPAFTVLFYVDYSIGFGPSSRYGISLIPLIGAAAAATYRTRRAMGVLVAGGALLLVTLLVAIVEASPIAA